MRSVLKNLYSVLKDLDPHLKFVLLTGVSKFSKVSLFSGLNNLEDLTLDPRVATLCGYTQAELVSAFADYLDGVDLAEVKHWYNGYNFLGEPVYNPFDILLYLRHREFKPYWFETGTPTFLIDQLRARRLDLPRLEGLWLEEELLGRFDVDGIEPETLMFQTGYLTIHERIWEFDTYRYRLGYPNREVRISLPRAVLNRYVPDLMAKERTRDPDRAGAQTGRSGGAGRGVSGVFRLHPPRLVSAQRPGRLRRLLGVAGLLPVRRAGGGDARRGTQPSRASGPGDPVPGPGVAAGIQGGRRRRPAGAGANQGPRLSPPLRRPASNPDRDGL
jgi:hypothetical protein